MLLPGRQLAVSLGPIADAYLRGRRATDADAFAILRAWLWNVDMESFVCVVVDALGWSAEDASSIWEMIVVP